MRRTSWSWSRSGWKFSGKKAKATPINHNPGQTMKTENPVIEVAHLVRKFGRAEAVNDLSLRVGAGRCYGFFGRNGAGKTTTIKCLLNLLQPGSGTVRVFGLD